MHARARTHTHAPGLGSRCLVCSYEDGLGCVPTETVWSMAQVAPFMAQLQRLELMNVMLSVSFDCPIFDSRVTDASIARVPHAAVRAPIPSRNGAPLLLDRVRVFSNGLPWSPVTGTQRGGG